MIVKGVNDVEDAITAKQFCDAIVVSNHGGRQLDGTLSSIRSLPLILDAVRPNSNNKKGGGNGYYPDKDMQSNSHHIGIDNTTKVHHNGDSNTSQDGSLLEVYIDGGIMAGQSVLKSVALGAQGVMVGKAFLYGLSAAGDV